MTVLLREAIGDRLRHARTIQRRTLREVSRTARVSLGYLSEVERGQKEASSELLAAICDALELPLSVLLHNVANDMTGLDPAELLEPAIADQQPAAKPADAEPKMSAAGLDGGMAPADLSLDVVGDTLSDLRIQPALTHRLNSPEMASAGVFAA
jgi:transcriptional regulator with XRE-family HTH domain